MKAIFQRPNWNVRWALLFKRFECLFFAFKQAYGLKTEFLIVCNSFETASYLVWPVRSIQILQISSSVLKSILVGDCVTETVFQTFVFV